MNSIGNSLSGSMAFSLELRELINLQSTYRYRFTNSPFLFIHIYNAKCAYGIKLNSSAFSLLRIHRSRYGIFFKFSFGATNWCAGLDLIHKLSARVRLVSVPKTRKCHVGWKATENAANRFAFDIWWEFLRNIFPRKKWVKLLSGIFAKGKRLENAQKVILLTLKAEGNVEHFIFHVV